MINFNKSKNFFTIDTKKESSLQYRSSHTGDYLQENEQIRIGNTSFLLT